MKYIKLLLCLCLLYTPFAFAVDLPPNNSWSWKHHEKMREQARLKARLVKQINESGSSKTITAIVETKPTPSKVGGAMLKRISHVAKTPGVQLIGVLAVTELLEGIGWVMKEGTYVKQIPKNQPFECSVDNLNFGDCNTILSQEYKTTATLSSSQITQYTKLITDAPTRIHTFGSTPVPCSPAKVGSCTSDSVIYATFYLRKANSTEYTDVPLTAPTLGAIMLGSGYVDPAGDTSAENTVNDGDWTSVPEAYTPDDSGIGNELAEELESKADNSPQTTDGKESSLTDSKYSNDLSSNDNANDRSWQSGDGTEATGDSTTTTDPETGNTSTTSTLKIPPFCEYAMTMCEWFGLWKESDQVQKDHMTKTEEHQTEEKSFWEDVKDWFDWTKEPVDEEPETEEEEPDTQGIFDRTFDTAFSLSKECPPDIPFSLETEFFSGSWNISMNWLCIIFTFLGYPLVFLSHCVGLWILYEAVVQREIKW